MKKLQQLRISFFRFATAKQKNVNIFQAATDFNSQFKIKHWIVYYDVRPNHDLISRNPLT